MAAPYFYPFFFLKPDASKFITSHFITLNIIHELQIKLFTSFCYYSHTNINEMIGASLLAVTTYICVCVYVLN